MLRSRRQFRVENLAARLSHFIRFPAKSLKEVGRPLLYQDLFFLPTIDRRLFQYTVSTDRMKFVFSAHNCRLGATPKVFATHARRWKLHDNRTVYLIKDTGNRISVSRERHPIVCRVLELAILSAPSRVRKFKWRFGQWLFQEGCAVKKWASRNQSTGSKRRINIGAGSWYSPGWQILDFQGKWYRYAKGFIDFEHDLTGAQPFPFANDAVDLFYCEHVFEHLKDSWCQHAFSEVFRCLKSGGGFRVVVPDADLIYTKLQERDTKFFENWMLRDNIGLEEAFRVLVGHSRGDFDEEEFNDRLRSMAKEEFLNWCTCGLDYDLRRAGEHINWFNYDKLAEMLREVGFKQVSKSHAQLSTCPEFRGLMFDTRPRYSLHLESFKSVYAA